MQISNLTLAYLLKEVSPVAVEGFVNKIQEIDSGIFKIKIHTKSGSKDLIVTQSAIFFSGYSFFAKHNPSSFFSKLGKILDNRKIHFVTQHNFDRVVVFEFEDYFLIREFFHKSNTILTDKNKKILFVHYREEWKDRSLKKGEEYKFPSSKGENPQNVSQKFLIEVFQKSEKPLIQTIVTHVNIAPLVAEEVLFVLKLDKTIPAKKVSKVQSKKIAEKINEFYSLKPGLIPVQWKDELLPFAFSSLKEQKPIKSIFSALDEFYGKKLVQKPAQKELKENQLELNSLNFSLELQKNTRQKHVLLVQENKSKADFIYEHFTELEEILKALKIAKKKKLDKKEVMYKLNSALEKKFNKNLKISLINFNRNEIEIDVKTN